MQDRAGFPESRMVNGDLLIATHIKLELESRPQVQTKVPIFEVAICGHFNINVLNERLWEIWFSDTLIDSDDPSLNKCCECQTDRKLCMIDRSGERRTLSVKIWKNYGSWGSLNEEMFVVGMDRKELESVQRRNTQTLFESSRKEFTGTWWHRHMRHRKKDSV
jgi:hypothetical protein